MREVKFGGIATGSRCKGCGCPLITFPEDRRGRTHCTRCREKSLRPASVWRPADAKERP